MSMPGKPSNLCCASETIGFADHSWQMPRYFFHLRNDISVDDEEGTELPGIEAARERAEQYAIDMAAASVLENHRINLHHRIEIADETGEVVLTVEFGDVLSIENRG